jgi:Polyprenyltransferase (cytochrome oxidase assembly factor)
LYKASDYKKAKIPMLPVSEGIEKTKIYIFVYSLLMVPTIILPYIINFAGLIYLIPSTLLTIYYCLICYELMNFDKNKFNSKQAKKVFTYSIFYLFLIFVFFLFDSLI